jgi:hypothetical protein
MNCPYPVINIPANNNYPMHVIGHYHEFIQYHARIPFRYALPPIINDPAAFRQYNFAVPYFPEQTFPVLGADGYVICPFQGIIVFRQADGTPALSIVEGPVKPGIFGRHN